MRNIKLKKLIIGDAYVNHAAYYRWWGRKKVVSKKLISLVHLDLVSTISITRNANPLSDTPSCDVSRPFRQSQGHLVSKNWRGLLL